MSSRSTFYGSTARLLAGIVLFSVASVSLPTRLATAQDDSTVVAQINDHSIRLSDVFAFIESFPLAEQLTMRQQLGRVVQSLANEELLFQSVLSAEAGWEKQLRNEIKSLVVKRMIEHYVKRQINVDDEAIRQYYQEHRDSLRGWHVRVRHIRLPARTECEAMLTKIDSEQTFIELAKAHSLDKLTASEGGDMGNLMYTEEPGPEALGFESAFFEMALDEMRIFESHRGCHLVRVVDIDDPPDPPFERIREFLRSRLEQLQESEHLQALLERASRDAQVNIDSSALE